MELWAEHCDLSDIPPWDLQLLSVDIIGARVLRQEPSHFSVVWLHNVISFAIANRDSHGEHPDEGNQRLRVDPRWQ